ncbi:hypothetical protein NAEGRDRAFT_50297 [Naegleria gruberi]|uniref:Actin n=1 Tax=Naegleria gruberi TaxID=5762 RepID=D2VKI0_NAEGR|nr:uncharacterized protein NAEGRDRAFT_50297 [Naegleria gruberi]EFC42693.1 hypothetical protein NAEGRDRAFT_50297 [Naegleria gruberi]|eukprot:XP_002675437.1 hypothetical protein NAEGRDRAFT_50297 [Naegleria gruberi strain NEG-M]
MSKSVVIDNGTYETRIGLSGEDAPLDIYQTQDPAFFYNDQSPMKRGLINNFDAMDRVWRYGFNKAMLKGDMLDGPATDMSVIMSEHTLAPKLHSERITQHMFEQYEIPGLFIANQGLLALYSCGKITGIVCDVGYEQTRFTPIYEGLAFPHAADFVNIGGKHANEYLKTLLQKQLLHSNNSMDTSEGDAPQKTLKINTEFSSMTPDEFNTVFNANVIEQIKRKLVYTSGYEYHKQMKLSQELKQKTEDSLLNGASEAETTDKKKSKAKSAANQVSYYKDYTLPDGKKVSVGQKERFLPTEIFFNPSVHLPGREFEIPGIQHILHDCANQCEFDTKKEMFSNIIVCGGTACINSFAERLRIEVQEVSTTSTIVSLVETKDPSNAVWYGASVLSSLSSFSSMWIKKTDYNDYGPQIIHRRTY